MIDTKIENVLEDNIGFIILEDKSIKDTALKIVNSARISYNKKKEEIQERDKELINFLKKEEHTSPFRHSWYTFHIKAPLIVFRQIFKYQVASYWRQYQIEEKEVSSTLFLDILDIMSDQEKGSSWNEISARYSILKEEFYIPPRMRSNAGHGNRQQSSDLPTGFNHEAYRGLIKDSYTSSYNTYKSLLRDGVAREIARAVLPQAIYSEAYWTISLQSVIHFLIQRLDHTAQWETQQYAKAIKQLIQKDLDMAGLEI